MNTQPNRQPPKNPLTPCKIAEFCVYAVALVFGFLYLTNLFVSLPVLMPVFTVCLLAAGVLRLVDLYREKSKLYFSYLTPFLFLLLGVILGIYTVKELFL